MSPVCLLDHFLSFRADTSTILLRVSYPLFSHNQRFPLKTLSTLLAIVYLLCCACLVTIIYLRRLSAVQGNYMCESRYNKAYGIDGSLKIVP